MTLHLTLKKKWFDMILGGEKKEEYRSLNVYWFTRLVDGSKKEIEYLFPFSKPTDHDIKLTCEDSFWKTTIDFKQFDYIHFYNGGAASLKYPNFIIECKGISIKKTIPEWSDNYKSECFTISLGKLIYTNNIKQ